MSGYYCWCQYYDRDTFKTTSSDEIRYADKHQHNVQPTEAQWMRCLENLFEKVNTIRKPPLVVLPRDTILLDAERKTRSEH